jgi:DNA polymerase III subunit gamma/tau
MNNSTINLTEKYRPVKFNDFLGNQEVVQNIQANLKSGMMNGWSCLLISNSSPGIGGTSLAVSIQQSLACLNRTICGQCVGCTQFRTWAHYYSMANKEHWLEFSRALQDNMPHPYGLFGSLPGSGAPNKKVIVCDEVHNLSKKDFESIKMYQEVGDQTMCILVTSEPDKIPDSTKSICGESYELTPPSSEEIADHLMKIAENENVTIDQDIENMIYEIASRRPQDVRMAVKRLGSKVIGPFHAGIKLLSSPSMNALPVQALQLAAPNHMQQFDL